MWMLGALELDGVLPPFTRRRPRPSASGDLRGVEQAQHAELAVLGVRPGVVFPDQGRAPQIGTGESRGRAKANELLAFEVEGPDACPVVPDSETIIDRRELEIPGRAVGHVHQEPILLLRMSIR